MRTGLPVVSRGGVSTLAMQAFDALVLDARLRQSLATVRSLGRRGLAVAALDTSRDAPAFSSRWCQRNFVCPAADGADGHLGYPGQLLGHPGARVGVPAG